MLHPEVHYCFMLTFTGYEEKLNNLAAYVVGAIEDFSKTEGSRANCDNVYCKTQKVLKKLDKKMSYKR